MLDPIQCEKTAYTLTLYIFRMHAMGIFTSDFCGTAFSLVIKHSKQPLTSLKFLFSLLLLLDYATWNLTWTFNHVGERFHTV